MIFGVILAGGIGSRMGNTVKPKQFLLIEDKPVIIHTIEKFIVNDKFEKVVVLCPEQWILYTKELFKKYFPNNNKVVVIKGGSVRNNTIMNAIQYIDDHYGLDDDTVVITHDAVRPFVTQRIIEENIGIAASGVPCTTIIPATDTIVESTDGEYVSLIPDRAMCYQCQTPQSFRAKKFKKLYNSMTQAEKDILTDATKVFVAKGEKVALVRGEPFNIKVTFTYDLQLAEILIKEIKLC